MAHECPDCGALCYCDIEDAEMEAPEDCGHVCQDNDDNDEFEVE